MRTLLGLGLLLYWLVVAVVLPCAVVGIAIHFIRKFW